MSKSSYNLDSPMHQDKGNTHEFKRLRTFVPLLQYYASAGDSSSILRLFRQMRESTGVYFESDTYGLIIGSLASNGSFRADGSPIRGALDNGFSASYGPGLFDDIAAEMADDLMEISAENAAFITKSFSMGFPEAGVDPDSIPYLQNETSLNCFRIGRVTIDHLTGVCPASGAKLRLLRLDDRQRRHVHDTLLEMAQSSFEEFRKAGKVRQDDDGMDDKHAYKELKKFSEWLE